MRTPVVALFSILLTISACKRAEPPAAASDAGAPDAPRADGTAAAPPPPPPPLGEATAFAQRALVFDGHIDVPYRLEESKAKDGSITEDVSARTEKGDFDFPRAKEGGLDGAFISIYVPAELQVKGGGRAMADGLIDMVEGIAKKNPDKFAMARSPAEVRANSAKGLFSMALGMENGAGVEANISNLKHFHARGVRYITLTHSKDNGICDSSYDETATWKGLSPFGKQVVAEMNRLGVIVDISHVSDATFWQVLELSKVPVIASHSSARAFTPEFQRNMSDDMIKAIAAKGGVVMINFGSAFLTGHAQKWSSAMYAARTKYKTENKLEDDDPKIEEWQKQYVETTPLPRATVKHVADHIDHVVKLGGIDHVGLGSDFDGVGDSMPEGLRDVSHYPNLFAELMARGWTEPDLEKLASGNVLRVWQAVEDHAAAAPAAAPASKTR